MNSLPGEGQAPVDRLETIRGLTSGLLLDGESGMWGSSPGRPMSREVAYVLPGESIGEGGTFFMVRCSTSDLGTFASMRQYSDFDTLADLDDSARGDEAQVPSDKAARPLRGLGAKPEGDMVLVSFFDTGSDYLSRFSGYADDSYLENLEPITETDVAGADDDLDRLIEVMGHPDLSEAVMSTDSLTQTFTIHNHLVAMHEAEHDAIIRVADGHPEMVKFADRFFLGIRSDEEYLPADAKKERVQPAILRWLKEKLRRKE